MRRSFCVIFVLFSLFLASCAVVKATNQPEKKDLSVLNTGNARANVIAELGSPATTEKKQGKRVDVFSFVQGYSKGAKAARALGHGVADVLTFGLWEVVGTPVEGLASGEANQVQVFYDEHDKVTKVVALRGQALEESSSSHG